jgi:superfamily I DNA/RNA helicase
MDIENFKKDVQVKTVHKSKGEEAEIVILLNINENVFPVSNSNNALFEVFGENLEDNYEDEQRLYYVALTRAKQDLYILYDKGNKSEFIMY